MTKLSRYAIALVLVLILGALAACGSDSGEEETATPPAPASDGMSGVDPVSADADAKSSVRELVSEMEVCFVEQQTYRGCKPGRAAAGVSAKATDLGYTVTAESKSGNEFVITRAGDGTLERTCTTKTEGGCKGGRW